MAYTSPPVFADGAVLSATQLNILSDDLTYLYGILQAPAVTFSSLYFNQDLASDNNGWAFRYRHRYFHYRLRVMQNTINSVSVVINGTTYGIDGDVRSAGHTYSGYVDVNAQGLTLGNIYEMYFVVDVGALSAGIVDFIIQAEGTSL